MGIIRGFIDANIALSQAIDRLLPANLREDGNKTFQRTYIPRAVQSNDLVYDVGGGSRPFLSAQEKLRLNARVVGLDISKQELEAAPAGIYDRIVVHDLCTYVGSGDADVAICQALLEHVPNTPGAIRALASTVKPGGRIFLFAPARNALFARLNLVLPERLKRKLLFLVFPHKATGHDGFRAYYHECVPSRVEELASLNNLQIVEKRVFWISSYFMVFVPAYLLWRAYQGLTSLFLGSDAAESFIYVFEKK